MKKYLIEFTHSNGEVEQIEFETDKGYDWTVQQFSRNRSVISDRLISETITSSKRMLLG